MKLKAILAVAAALTLASCTKEDAPQADTYIQAHTTQQLMANVMEPTAEVYWKSSGFVVDETGEHDLTPTTEEGWLATRTSAATITELGNLLMTPLYAEGRGEDWIEFSRALVEVGKQAEQTAIDRDPDAIMEVGGTMYNVCSACHQIYPPQVAPEAGEAESEAAE
jgi:hypothetical protein